MALIPINIKVSDDEDFYITAEQDAVIYSRIIPTGRVGGLGDECNVTVTEDSFVIGSGLLCIQGYLAIVQGEYRISRLSNEIQYIKVSFEKGNEVDNFRILASPNNSITESDLSKKGSKKSEFLLATFKNNNIEMHNKVESLGEASSKIQTFLPKIADIISSEADRKSSEQGRVSAESNRVSKEQERVQAEATRVQKESERVSKEQERTQAEATRVQKESERVSKEQERVQAEATRVQKESERVSKEQERTQAEQSRGSAENDRVSKKQERVQAEQGRVSAENDRVSKEQERTQAEQGRASAENDRVSKEQERVQAEQGRVSAENDRVSKEQERTQAEQGRASAENDRVSKEQERKQWYDTIKEVINNSQSGNLANTLQEIRESLNNLDYVDKVELEGTDIVVTKKGVNTRIPLPKGFSGSYTDLSNKPKSFPTNWDSISDKPTNFVTTQQLDSYMSAINTELSFKQRVVTKYQEDLNDLNTGGFYSVRNCNNRPSSAGNYAGVIVLKGDLTVGSELTDTIQLYIDNKRDLYIRNCIDTNATSWSAWKKMGGDGIGELSQLNTSNKSSLVSAINEVFQLGTNVSNSLKSKISSVVDRDLSNLGEAQREFDKYDVSEAFVFKDIAFANNSSLYLCMADKYIFKQDDISNSSVPVYNIETGQSENINFTESSTVSNINVQTLYNKSYTEKVLFDFTAKTKKTLSNTPSRTFKYVIQSKNNVFLVDEEYNTFNVYNISSKVEKTINGSFVCANDKYILAFNNSTLYLYNLDSFNLIKSESGYLGGNLTNINFYRGTSIINVYKSSGSSSTSATGWVLYDFLTGNTIKSLLKGAESPTSIDLNTGNISKKTFHPFDNYNYIGVGNSKNRMFANIKLYDLQNTFDAFNSRVIKCISKDYIVFEVELNLGSYNASKYNYLVYKREKVLKKVR